MSKKNIENCTRCQYVGADLLKAVYAVMYRLDATDAVINKVRYNRWAEVELFEGGDAIDWHYQVNVWEG